MAGTAISSEVPGGSGPQLCLSVFFTFFILFDTGFHVAQAGFKFKL